LKEVSGIGERIATAKASLVEDEKYKINIWRPPQSKQYNDYPQI